MTLKVNTLNSILQVTTTVVFGYTYFLFLKIETFLENIRTFIQNAETYLVFFKTLFKN